MTAREHIDAAQQSLPKSTRGWGEVAAAHVAQAHALVAIALALTEGGPAVPKVGMVFTDEHGNRHEITGISTRTVR